MGILRKSMAAVSAAALVVSVSAAAAAPVRPSDSLVSASEAAKAPQLVGRQGATVQDASSLTPAQLLLLLLALIGGGILINELIEESP